MDSHYKLHKWGKEIFYQFMDITLDLIKMGQKQNELRDIDPNSIAKVLRGILNSYIFHRVFWASNLTVDLECNQIMDLFLYGAKA